MIKKRIRSTWKVVGKWWNRWGWGGGSYILCGLILQLSGCWFVRPCIFSVLMCFVCMLRLPFIEANFLFYVQFFHSFMARAPLMELTAERTITMFRRVTKVKSVAQA